MDRIFFESVSPFRKTHSFLAQHLPAGPPWTDHTNWLQSLCLTAALCCLTLSFQKHKVASCPGYRMESENDLDKATRKEREAFPPHVPFQTQNEKSSFIPWEWNSQNRQSSLGPLCLITYTYKPRVILNVVPLQKIKVKNKQTNKQSNRAPNLRGLHLHLVGCMTSLAFPAIQNLEAPRDKAFLVKKIGIQVEKRRYFTRFTKQELGDFKS